MKQQTKSILDSISFGAESGHITRARRDLMVFPIDDEFEGAVAIQHREWADNVLTIDLVSMVFSESFLRVGALLWDEKYKKRTMPTASKLLIDLRQDIDTSDKVDIARKVALVVKAITGDAVQIARTLTTLEVIEQFIKPHVGGGRIERQLQFEIWAYGLSHAKNRWPEIHASSTHPLFGLERGIAGIVRVAESGLIDSGKLKP